MDTEKIKILLERYQQGRCSPEEEQIILQWFEGINGQQQVLIDEALLQRQLEEVKLSINEHLLPRRRNLRPWLYSGIAAAILLAAGIFFFNRNHSPASHPFPSTVAHQTSPGSYRTVRNGFVEIATAKGATEKITLPDGSAVTLNAASKLRYRSSFGNTREIYLEEGEAFFNVAADPARRFTVHAGELATTALGTSFNIRAYHRENKITVALLTGKVQINNNTNNTDSGTILLPSQQLSFNRQSLALVKTSFSKEDDITGWQKGYFIFKDAPYQEIVTAIENRYGVKIINNSHKTTWNYTGYFKDENLQDVMETICLATSLSCTIKNDTIYLENKK